MRSLLRVGALVGATLPLLAGCGIVNAAHSAPHKDKRLAHAYDRCINHDNVTTLSLEDSGHTLSIDTQDGSTENLQGTVCTLRYLHTPHRVIDDIANMTAMMGRQSDDAKGLHYSYSFHPDNGLNMVITDSKQ